RRSASRSAGPRPRRRSISPPTRSPMPSGGWKAARRPRGWRKRRRSPHLVDEFFRPGDTRTSGDRGDGDGAEAGYDGDGSGGPRSGGGGGQPRQAVYRGAGRGAGARLLGVELHARIRRREGQVRRSRGNQWRNDPGRSEGGHVHPRHRDGLRRGEAAIRLRVPQPERKRPLRLRRILPRLVVSNRVKLFQIEEPDGSPADPDAPGAAIGIDATGAEGEVAFAVGGNAVALDDREGFALDLPVPAAAAAAEDWRSFFEGARLRAERALGRPVTHAV